MSVWSLTLEKVEKTKGELVEKETQLTKLQETSIEALWLSDLDELTEKLDEMETKEERDWAEADKLEKAPKQGKLVGKKKNYTEKNNIKLKDKIHDPFTAKVRGRKPHKKAPSGPMNCEYYDSNSAEEPRVIKKPLSSRQKKAEISADPNKAPAEDPIKVKTSEPVISQKSSNILHSYSENDDQRGVEQSYDLYYDMEGSVGKINQE
jgi:hypothetical protein